MPSPRPARLGAALLSVVALSSCSASHLQFRADHRLRFSAPADRAKVTAPLTVSWSMSGFETVGYDGSTAKDKGFYAVFVDRAPMPVGKSLDWLVRKDTACARDPKCPNPQYLAEQDVYLTTTPSVVIDRIPAASDGVGDEQHSLTVVLLDGKGTRTVESAWYRTFRTKRSSNT